MWVQGSPGEAFDPHVHSGSTRRCVVPDVAVEHGTNDVLADDVRARGPAFPQCISGCRRRCRIAFHTQLRMGSRW
jgi:hypothetical protein